MRALYSVKAAALASVSQIVLVWTFAGQDTKHGD